MHKLKKMGCFLNTNGHSEKNLKFILILFYKKFQSQNHRHNKIMGLRAVAYLVCLYQKCPSLPFTVNRAETTCG